MQSYSNDRRPRALKLVSAAIAAASLASTATAQECVDDLLAAQPVDFLTPCPLGGSCDLGSFTKFEVSGFGSALNDMILSLQGMASQPEHWVVEVTDLIPVGAPTLPTYDPIAVDMAQFPEGLTLISRHGPNHVVIDGGGAQPAIFVDTAFGLTGNLRIGLATTALEPTSDLDVVVPPAGYAGWHGFTLTGGRADGIGFGPLGYEARDGGGISVSNVVGRLDVVGNVIRSNEAVDSGGGIFLSNCNQAVVAVNDIYDNTAAVESLPSDPFTRGGGIYQVAGFVEMVANIVRDNGFGAKPSVGATELPRQGGGIAANTAESEGSQATQMCANYVHGNEASQGGGIWIDLSTHGFYAQAHLVQNIVANNEPWFDGDPSGLEIDGGYQGGGIWIQGESTATGLSFDPFNPGPGNPIVIGEPFYLSSIDDSLPLPLVTVAVPFPASSLSSTLFNNRILENSIENPGFTTTAFDDEAGGGLFSFHLRNDETDQVSISGNAVVGNTAAGDGGGIFLDHPSALSPPISGEIYHNTIAWNDATDVGSVGGGIFLAAATRFDGSSNVFFDNRLAGLLDPLANWFGEGFLIDDFNFTQMNLAVPPMSADLVGVGCSAVDPGLVVGDYHLGDASSPAIDSAEVGLMLPLAVDIDLDDRVLPLISAAAIADRGADEFVETLTPIGFLRGDANADGCIDIADVNYILASLLTPGSPPIQSPAAGDANFDWGVDISDAIFLLAYLFAGGPPPFQFGDCLTESDLPPLYPLGVGSGTPCICQ